ncbi:MAG: hypothetical protein QW794_04865 [Thermosphaera sp.]
MEVKRGTTLSTITSLIALLLLAIAIVTPASASTILTIERGLYNAGSRVPQRNT